MRIVKRFVCRIKSLRVVPNNNNGGFRGHSYRVMLGTITKGSAEYKSDDLGNN